MLLGCIHIQCFALQVYVAKLVRYLGGAAPAWLSGYRYGFLNLEERVGPNVDLFKRMVLTWIRWIPLLDPR